MQKVPMLKLTKPVAVKRMGVAVPAAAQPHPLCGIEESWHLISDLTVIFQQPIQSSHLLGLIMIHSAKTKFLKTKTMPCLMHER